MKIRTSGSRKMKGSFTVGLFLVGIFASALTVGVSYESGLSDPTLSFSPAVSNVTVGQHFSVNASIDYAEKLYGFEVWISFNNTKLSATSISYMDYFNSSYNNFHEEVNNTGGYVALAISKLGPVLGKTGGSPPPLARINFTAIGMGTSQLHFLGTTVLSDDQGNPMSHQRTDGTVYVAPGTNHDVAVTSVIPKKSIAGQGYTCNVSVVTENHGGFGETYNVTLRANETEIATREVTVQPAATATVNFTWNTSSFAFGGYTIRAYAWPVPGETFTSDNNYTNGQVLVLWPGDIQLAYRKIDMKDIAYIAKRFGLPPSDPLWDPNADLNNDGKVDMRDIGTVAKYFGLTY